MLLILFLPMFFTDNSSVTVTELSNDTVPGTYALAKSGSDYTLAGVTLSQSGSVYSSGSGDKMYEIKYFRYKYY